MSFGSSSGPANSSGQMGIALAATPLFQVDVQQEAPGVVAIHCRGELDLSTCDELREAINWLFTPDLSTLRVDLTGLTCFDSAGVNCLLECHQSCIALSVDLEIAPSPVVARVLDLVDFREATKARILPPATPIPATTADSGTGPVADQPGGNEVHVRGG
ncbi:MAG: anti-sigma factor antagonist [Gaiellales bacterium]|nr:anti-sigma factor antagonist [Gaiellales bacterium]